MHWRRKRQPTPVFLPGESHGQRSLVGCSPWGRKKSDTTERLSFHFSLSCIGEGNGNPPQCSCLENPRDRGAWWAAFHGVAQSWTRLKRLSSSSGSIEWEGCHIIMSFCCCCCCYVASVVSDSVRPHRWQPTRLPCPWDSPGKNTGVGCHFLLQCMKVKSERKVAQLCPTLSDPMDCSLPGSSIHGSFQARVLK